MRREIRGKATGGGGGGCRGGGGLQNIPFMVLWRGTTEGKDIGLGLGASNLTEKRERK